MKFTKKQLSFGAFTGLILFGLIGVYFFYVGYDNWKEKRTYDRAIEAQRKVEEAYRNDTYGGKTPQETLDLFIEAIRAGDVELASKYFALDDALSRDKWLEYLREVKNSNLLNEMADDLAAAKEYKSLYEGNQQFILFNKDYSDSLIINFELNPISKVWKIESL